MPGVVRLLDEGHHLEQAFVVMNLVEGMPFPGSSTPMAWEALEPIAISLLHTLGRMHALGLVHRDIKPSNVLVAEQSGATTIVDFGIAHPVGRRWDDMLQADGWAGTPAYLAPELLLGDAPTATSDLYAAAVMIYEALAGGPAYATTDIGPLLRDKLSGPPVGLSHLARAPAHMRGVLAALLAPSPEERPGSAEDAIERMQETSAELHARRPSMKSELDASKPYSEDRLRELFAGPDRILHLREDAARLLFARTRGTPRLVEETLESWTRAGHIRRIGPAYTVDRDALETLELVETPALLSVRRRAAPTPSELVLTSLRLASRVVRAGQHGLASRVYEEAAHTLREVDAPALAARLFGRWIEFACTELVPAAVDRLLYEIVRTKARSEQLSQLARLAQAALDITLDPPRARRQLEAMDIFGQRAIERTRAALRMVASRTSSIAEQKSVLLDIERWASENDDEATRGRVHGWHGRIHYCDNAFELAAREHERAALLLPLPLDKTAAQLNAASAYVEAFRSDLGLTLANTALASLRAYRHPLLEARAEWIRRMAAYRLEMDLAPDPELLEAADRLAMPSQEANIVLLEAVVHFRAGRVTDAARLARRAESIWNMLRSLPDAALLARAIAYASGDQVDGAEGLLERARGSSIAGIGLQVVGLLAKTGALSRADREEAIARFYEQIPKDHRKHRMDVLSADEALGYLKGAEL